MIEDILKVEFIFYQIVWNQLKFQYDKKNSLVINVHILVSLQILTLGNKGRWHFIY